MSLIGGGCSEPPKQTTELVRPVKTMVVAAGDDVRTRSFPGTVEASRRVELAFQVPGLLVKLPVSEGQKVAKGDVIAELRQDEFQARLTSLQGQLDQARAALTALASWRAPRGTAAARSCRSERPRHGSPTPGKIWIGKRICSPRAAHRARNSKRRRPPIAWRTKT